CKCACRNWRTLSADAVSADRPDCAAAAHTGCQTRGVARACWASEPDTGRIRPLQLLMNAFQTCSSPSFCQPGNDAHEVCTNLPASVRGVVSGNALSAGTRKGCSA